MLVICAQNRASCAVGRVSKRYVPLYVNKSAAYLGYSRPEWHTSSGPDVLGNALLSRSGGGDPS
eukprot:SAG11_NODE_13752_length_641_cov_1.014760_1_plen_63_part_10